jgi:hypothetical protein
MPYLSDTFPAESVKAVYSALFNFLPSGSEGLRNRWPPTPMHFWTAWAWAWVDSSSNLPSQPGQQVGATVGIESDRRAIACEFRRWNGHGGATPEMEEALAASPLARESWERKVAEVMAPVTAWWQERWDIQLAQRHVFTEKEVEEEEEEEEEEDEEEEEEE